MTRKVVLEGDDVAACHECDSYDIYERAAKSPRYACYQCDWEGEEYLERDTYNEYGGAEPGENSAAAQPLVEADPEDVTIGPATPGDVPNHSSGRVRMCDRCGSRVADKSLVDGECAGCRTRDDDFDPRKALLSDGGHERERDAPETRLTEAAKQIKLAANDVGGEDRVDLEHLAKSVERFRDELHQDDPDLATDGGRRTHKLAERAVQAQERQARALERVANIFETAVDGDESVLLADGGTPEMPGESLDTWAEEVRDDLAEPQQRNHIPDDADDDWCPGPEGLERGELPCLKCFREAAQEQRDAYNAHPSAEGTVRLAEGDQ